MRKYIVLLLSVFFFLSCSSDSNEPSAPETPAEKAPITVMAYFVADNNLAGDLLKNIVQSYEALLQSEKEATFLVYWDGPASRSISVTIDYSTWASVSVPNSWTEPAILRFKTQGHGKVNGTSWVAPSKNEANYHQLLAEYYAKVMEAGENVKTYPAQLSTQMETMASVLRDMVSASPTQRVGLIAASHGSGWLEHITGRNSRSFGEDGSTRNTISTAQIAQAMSTVDRKFDFMLFDSCMMGCAEVCYDLRNVVDYLIASPVNVPSPGFPYTEMLNHLFEGSIQGYKKACEIYVNRYINEQSSNIHFGAISIIDCRMMDALAAEVKNVITSHSTFLSTYQPDELQQYGESGKIFEGFSYDLMQFVEEVTQGQVPVQLDDVFSRAMVYTAFVPDSYIIKIYPEHYCGLGLYIPHEDRIGWNDYFKTIDWYEAAGWNQVSF